MPIALVLFSCKSVSRTSKLKDEISARSTSGSEVVVEAAIADKSSMSSYLQEAKSSFDARDYPSTANALAFFIFHAPDGASSSDITKLCEQGAKASSADIINRCYQIGFLYGTAMTEAFSASLDSSRAFALKNPKVWHDTKATMEQYQVAEPDSYIGNLARSLLLLNTRSADENYSSFIIDQFYKNKKNFEVNPYSSSWLLGLAAFGAYQNLKSYPRNQPIKLGKEVFGGLWSLEARVSPETARSLGNARHMYTKYDPSLKDISKRFYTESLVPEHSEMWGPGRTYTDFSKSLISVESLEHSAEEWSKFLKRADSANKSWLIFLVATHPQVSDPFINQSGLSSEQITALRSFDPLEDTWKAANFKRLRIASASFSSDFHSAFGTYFGCNKDPYIRCAALEYIYKPQQTLLYRNIASNGGAKTKKCFQGSQNHSVVFESYSPQDAQAYGNCYHFLILDSLVDASWTGALVSEGKTTPQNSSALKLVNEFVIGPPYTMFKSFDLDHAALIPLPAKRDSDPSPVTVPSRYLCARYIADEGSWHDDSFFVDNEDLKGAIKTLYFYNRMSAALANPSDTRLANLANYTVSGRWAESRKNKSLCSRALIEMSVQDEIIKRVELLLSEYETTSTY